MQTLNFPKYQFKIKDENGKRFIWDAIRKKYLALQPEEWVRQHLVQFLIKERHFPKSLIALEKGLTVNKMFRRTDVVAYTKNGQPCMIAECKAPQVKIKQATFEQIARYNLALKVPYLIVTNGLQHFCCYIDFATNNYHFLEDIPDYKDLKF